MNFHLKNKNLTRALYLCLALCGAIAFYFIITNIGGALSWIGNVVGAAMPVVFGFVIAYFLRPLVNKFENLFAKLSRKKNRKKRSGVRRMLAILFSYLLVIAIIVCLFSFIIPEVGTSIAKLSNEVPTYANNVVNWINSLLDDLLRNDVISRSQLESIETYVKNFAKTLTDWLTNALPGLIQTTTQVVGTVVNLVFGFMLAIYVLLEKEKLARQSKMLLHAFLPERAADSFISTMREADHIFGGYISSKIIEVSILGIICFICMTIIGIPYALLISVIFAISNLIPMFGAIIGAIPCALLILAIDPLQALWYIILVIVLGQFDGNILGPKLLGDSTGLSALLVMFSIFVGGGLYGVVGMFFAVPTFAVLYMLLKRLVFGRLKKKNYGGEDMKQLSFEDTEIK